MMHKAWSSIEELPYCFSRSSVNFQGHIALKIVEFDPNWAFPDCNSSLNAPMAMKCCTKLETAKKRCPIVFQGHPSDFKVTGDKTSPILTQIRHFRTIGRSQLSNPSDLPCFLATSFLHHWYYITPNLRLWLYTKNQLTWLRFFFACDILLLDLCIVLTSKIHYNINMGIGWFPWYQILGYIQLIDTLRTRAAGNGYESVY